MAVPGGSEAVRARRRRRSVRLANGGARSNAPANVRVAEASRNPPGIRKRIARSWTAISRGGASAAPATPAGHCTTSAGAIATPSGRNTRTCRPVPGELVELPPAQRQSDNREPLIDHAGTAFAASGPDGALPRTVHVNCRDPPVPESASPRRASSYRMQHRFADSKG